MLSYMTPTVLQSEASNCLKNDNSIPHTKASLFNEGAKIVTKCKRRQFLNICIANGGLTLISNERCQQMDSTASLALHQKIC